MRFTDLGREIREQSCPTSPRSPGAAGDSGSPSLVRREAGSQVRGGGHTAQLGHQAEGDRGLRVVLRQGVDLVLLKEEVGLVLQLVVILVHLVEELALE